MLFFYSWRSIEWKIHRYGRRVSMCSRSASLTWCHFPWRSKQNLFEWYIKTVGENPKLFNSVVSQLNFLILFCFNQFHHWSKPNSTQHSAVQYVKFFFSFYPRNKPSRTFQCLAYSKHLLWFRQFVPLPQDCISTFIWVLNSFQKARLQAAC